MYVLKKEVWWVCWMKTDAELQPENTHVTTTSSTSGSVERKRETGVWLLTEKLLTRFGDGFFINHHGVNNWMDGMVGGFVYG